MEMHSSIETMDEDVSEVAADDTLKKNINELPDEVLEYIFSLVSPYKDLKECMVVCKRWYSNVKNVVRLQTLKLTNALSNMDVAWQSITPVEMAPTITKRYSHSACYHENSMYVFGGCTSTSTTFNDLWRLDLNRRQWDRPLTEGTYPSPKACASMVNYQNALIVFGGWTLPSPSIPHQTWRLFNELHIYSIVKNRWMCINTTFSPPGMAGHSASVHGDLMVVFGGLKSESPGQYLSSNDVWCFNLKTQEWHKQATSGVKPHTRYGQSQIWLGDQHLLIMGGAGGPNMIFNDVWLLSLVGREWEWREVEVQNKEWSATYMWCHRACRIGDQVVMMSRDPRPLKLQPRNGLKIKPRPRSSSAMWMSPRYEDSALNIPQRKTPVFRVDRDCNVNGQRGTFSRGISTPSMAGGSLKGIATKSDSQPSSSCKINQNHAKIVNSFMDCDPGPSGLSCSSSHKSEESRSQLHLDCQAGSSGTSKPLNVGGNTVQGKTDFSSDVSPSCSYSNTKDCNGGSSGKEEMQDNAGASPSSQNVHNWDRLRPINRLPGGEHGVGNIQLAAFQDQDQAARTCPSRARERQMQAIQRFEERLRVNNQAKAQEHRETDETTSTKPQRALVVCVLDISNVLGDECSVRWLALSPDSCSSGPEETILYTLVAGRGELIMFGGIHRDAMTILTNSDHNCTSDLSNSLHFISAPHGVI